MNKERLKGIIKYILAAIGGITLVGFTLNIAFNINIGTMFGDVVNYVFMRESKPVVADIAVLTDVTQPPIVTGTATTAPTPPDQSSPPILPPEAASLTRDGLTLTDGAIYTGSKLGDSWFVYELPQPVKLVIGDSVLSLDTDGRNSEYISGATGTAVDGGKAIRYKSGAVVNVRKFTVWFTSDSEYYVESITQNGVLTLSNGQQAQGVRVEETAADYTAFAFNFENDGNLPYMVTYMLDDRVLRLRKKPPCTAARRLKI